MKRQATLSPAESTDAVRSVNVFPLEYVEAVDNDSTRYVVLVRIESRRGAVGWGECFTLFREATAATTAFLRSGFTDFLIGEDPLAVERHWRGMNEKSWWYGHSGGIASFAISAVDMALWDLKGKILGLNLSQMLGGALAERLPACASSHPSAPTIEGMARELADHVAAGFQLVKVGFGKKGDANLGTDEARDTAFVRAAREAIGPDAGLCIDVGPRCRWDLPRTVRTARAMAREGITWMEDPFAPDRTEDYQALRRAVPEVPIAYGERLYTVEDYRRALEARLCDVLLIDPGRAGGVTGMSRAIRLAAEHGVAIDAHSFSSAINSAASVH
ncbi:MAG: mandelate racemase/muconate lactonizing enzyme family protein, partial [Spirochaetaceae bacterium]